MWTSLTGQNSAGFIKLSCVSEQKVENAGLHQIEENNVIACITVIDAGVYHGSMLLAKILLHSAGHSSYVIFMCSK
jgi:hypothetical protein